jgi:hypothetical protein
MSKFSTKVSVLGHRRIEKSSIDEQPFAAIHLAVPLSASLYVFLTQAFLTMIDLPFKFLSIIRNCSTSRGSY